MSQNNYNDKSKNRTLPLRGDLAGQAHGVGRNALGVRPPARKSYFANDARPLGQVIAEAQQTAEWALASVQQLAPRHYDAVVLRHDGRISANALAAYGIVESGTSDRSSHPDAQYFQIKVSVTSPLAGHWPEPIATEQHPAIGARGDHWAINKNPTVIIPPNTRVPPVGSMIKMNFPTPDDYLSNIGRYIGPSAGPSVTVGAGDTMEQMEEDSPSDAFAGDYNTGTLADFETET